MKPPSTPVDPSVAALLEDLPSDTPTGDVRVRIALMKLQQARIRGNSDYAAKIMDRAIEEGVQDREAWMMLDQRMQELEKRCQESAKEESNTTSSDERGKKDTDEPSPDVSSSGAIAGAEREGSVDVVELERLRREVEEANTRANTMEGILLSSFQNEAESIRKEQESLEERQNHLRHRIHELHRAVQDLPATAPCTTSRTDLEEALKAVHEEQSILFRSQCSICHEEMATRAVIPCGHLCLCDACTTRLTERSTSEGQKLCPLCRGHMLSTLHIYTSK